MGYVSGVYYSNWSVYESKHFPQHVDVAHLSHVFYAFMKIDDRLGKVSLSDPWADLDLDVGGESGCLGQWTRLKRENRHLKVVMSVGGWGTDGAFQCAVASELNMGNFVDSVVGLVEKFKFDGVDIDWEYPASRDEGAKLCELLEFLRLALNSVRSGLLLTVAAPGSAYNSRHLDVSRMDAVLSFWNVMCYDFAGAGWSSKAGYHLNLYGAKGDNDLNVDDLLAHYMRKGVHPQKLVMGMPLYGRSFYSPTSHQVGAPFLKTLPLPTDTVDYRDIPSRNENYDSKKVAAYTYDDTKQILITYDNPRCVIEKGRYAKNHSLRGGFWWDSKGESQDSDRKLINTFVEQLGGPSQLDHTPNWV